MNIYEVSEKFGITLAKLRKMEKDGLLRVESSRKATDEIFYLLKRGKSLTVAHLLELVENPGGLLELGKYGAKAGELVDALGKPQDEAAPREVAAYILEAYQNQSDAVGIVARWMTSVIPAHPVGHAYIAVRLLLGVAEASRKYDIPRMQRALMNCRNNPALAGHWRTEKRSSQNVTVYQRGAKISLDL